jgi:hypothetical protein
MTEAPPDPAATHDIVRDAWEGVDAAHTAQASRFLTELISVLTAPPEQRG